MIKSPFFVIEDAISPAKCDIITSLLGIKVPSRNEAGKPLKHERIIQDAELVQYLNDAISDHLPEIDERYGAEIRALDQLLFQQYFEDPSKPCEPHHCDNAILHRKKWTRTKDTDLVGYLWLKDFNSGVPLDPSFEVYGGKLEFPAYNFSLVPQRGTLVLFPGGPHFITATSPILVGSLEVVRLSLKLHTADGKQWEYVPADYPGTYQDWF